MQPKPTQVSMDEFLGVMQRSLNSCADDSPLSVDYDVAHSAADFFASVLAFWASWPIQLVQHNLCG